MSSVQTAEPPLQSIPEAGGEALVLMRGNLARFKFDREGRPVFAEWEGLDYSSPPPLPAKKQAQKAGLADWEKIVYFGWGMAGASVFFAVALTVFDKLP